MYRLGRLVEDREVKYSHPTVYRIHESSGGRSPRIVAGVPESNPDVLLRLARCLDESLYLLYVLHTPRGEAEAGRYQSTELTYDDVVAFINDFRTFLSTDARFDLWVYSPSLKATLVWDRHDLLHAYGPIECYEDALRAAGFTLGDPVIPVPHAHHYRSEFDAQAAKVIARFDWIRSPLRPEDEQ